MLPVKANVLNRLFTALGLLCLSCCLAACGGSPAPSAPTTSTTLQAETGNNTSTADSFAGQTNGNPRAGNVSKLPIGSLLYSGATTKVYATWLGWFGQSNHINVGYSSDSPQQVHAQVQDMMSRGIAGAIADWFGVASSSEAATQLLKTEAESSAGQFQFAIMEDKGSLNSAALSNGCDVTDQLISDLNYIASQYESSPAYITVGGRPVVYFFDVDAFYVDWARVLSSVTGNPLGVDFAAPTVSQRVPPMEDFHGWSIQHLTPFDPELSLQVLFFQAAKQAPSRLAVGTAFKGFNDTLAAWGTNRVIDQDCGETWLQSLSETGKFYSSGNQLPPALQIATWNDYEEGTGIETGIEQLRLPGPLTIRKHDQLERQWQ